MILNHDGFARQELHKDKVGLQGECDWCGQHHNLYSFSVVRDDDPRARKNEIRGRFCSVRCMRAYNN